MTLKHTIAKQFLCSVAMIFYLQTGYSQNNEFSILKDNTHEIELNGGYFVIDNIRLNIS